MPLLSYCTILLLFSTANARIYEYFVVGIDRDIIVYWVLQHCSIFMVWAQTTRFVVRYNVILVSRQPICMYRTIGENNMIFGIGRYCCRGKAMLLLVHLVFSSLQLCRAIWYRLQGNNINIGSRYYRWIQCDTCIDRHWCAYQYMMMASRQHDLFGDYKSMT